MKHLHILLFTPASEPAVKPGTKTYVFNGHLYLVATRIVVHGEFTLEQQAETAEKIARALGHACYTFGLIVDSER